MESGSGNFFQFWLKNYKYYMEKRVCDLSARPRMVIWVFMFLPQELLKKSFYWLDIALWAPCQVERNGPHTDAVTNVI